MLSKVAQLYGAWPSACIPKPLFLVSGRFYASLGRNGNSTTVSDTNDSETPAKKIGEKEERNEFHPPSTRDAERNMRIAHVESRAGYPDSESIDRDRDNHVDEDQAMPNIIRGDN
mmetsp:Transcript_14224/g.24331  ORF Transcript_14224/g.24331 Transcript_14224/m.24331 type:complete len:115 (-) Transcript_14224:374-718(-)|eukprot:CAMPEP_0196662012 /NCGR_PEP_ID=MMETSP1086-20130531/46847_1 /TAXON_ID=77921 /ORGANISM="Cyanoptyche  gloeocystis , Strain SAG4.97" /LENGTH=114 /DNA_ID=CAMNT_0041997191 /DNA_START=26 /DNA_END=370 /DNA_ORIENTATION=+